MHWNNQTGRLNAPLCEDTIEQAALSWLAELGYLVLSGSLIAPGEPESERESFADVVLADRLRDAIRRLNPHLPDEATDDAFRKPTRPDFPSLIQNNRIFQRRLRDGVIFTTVHKFAESEGQFPLN
jgi:type I restriction enzyme R subunit